MESNVLLTPPPTLLALSISIYNPQMQTTKAIAACLASAVIAAHHPYLPFFSFSSSTISYFFFSFFLSLFSNEMTQQWEVKQPCEQQRRWGSKLATAYEVPLTPRPSHVRHSTHHHPADFRGLLVLGLCCLRKFERGSAMATAEKKMKKKGRTIALIRPI